MKKYSFIILFFIAFTVNAQHENHQPKADTSKNALKPKSPRQTAMTMIGANHVHIDYGSPSVRGRQIWNGLVAYKQVWSTGAHKATWIEFSENVIIDGKNIPKGKYGFFTIPDKKIWTLILSKTWDMHLADDYKPENDLIRIKVKPKKSKKITEALNYKITALQTNKGQVSLYWEYLSVSFEFINSKK